MAAVLVFTAGLGVRRTVLNTQRKEWGWDLPFTLESALHFRRVRLIYETGELPIHDTMVEYPTGVNVRETYTVGDEKWYARLAHLFPRATPLQDRVRWIEAAWFSFGAVVLGWWLNRLLVTPALGWCCALLYAVAPASVVRSTGQELSHENTALPVLLGHLGLHLLSWHLSGWRRAAAVVGSAILLGWALCWWDLIQFYAFLWIAYWSVRLLCASVSWEEIYFWPVHVAALVLAGTINPYHRTHGYAVSPIMLWAYGVTINKFVRVAAQRGWIRKAWARRSVLVGLTLLPLLVGLLFTTSYHESYGHFAQLIWAKVRHLNVKPADPARLTFDQRILWVPGLNSANWRLTRALFPGMLWLSLGLVPFWVRRSDSHLNPKIGQHLWFLGASLATYVFFVRFHVFVAVFAVICLAWGLDTIWARTPRWRPVIMVALVAMFALEASGSGVRPRRWGRPGVYYDELRELTAWLRVHVAPDPVLANFGVSGSILAYGECPIVLHPKFESAEARRRVREYAEFMFKGNEKELRDWACRYGAEYMVYSMGEFASFGLDQQMRYMVNALNPAADAPARWFEFSPDKCRYFKLVWSNRKYRVFDILTCVEEQQSAAYARNAQRALERGDLLAAEYAATQSLMIDSRCAAAQQVLRHVMVLREEGFKTPGSEP